MIRALAFTALLATPALAHDDWYEATPIRVIDGDTVELTIYLGLGIATTETVRLAGIDTPELRGKCEAEKIGAHLAQRRLIELLDDSVVSVHAPGRDKFGRILARISVDGQDIAEVMLAEGLGRENHGEKRGGWCR